MTQEEQSIYDEDLQAIVDRQREENEQSPYEEFCEWEYAQ